MSAMVMVAPSAEESDAMKLFSSKAESFVVSPMFQLYSG